MGSTDWIRPDPCSTEFKVQGLAGRKGVAFPEKNLVSVIMKRGNECHVKKR
jgi:hypothetical protein